jgi:chaperonin GroES
MKVRPLGERVVVQPRAKEEVTKSGIILAGGEERPEEGTIIAVGSGKQLDNGGRAPMQVAVGDRILFKKYGPDEVKIDGEKLFILEESDILAVIE